LIKLPFGIQIALSIGDICMISMITNIQICARKIVNYLKKAFDVATSDLYFG